MRASQLFVASLAASTSFASPLQKRQALSDIDILNYALTLEFLERKFYQEGLANYTQQNFIDAGYPNPFYARLKVIANDEKTHVDFLTQAIIAANGVPVCEASYTFPSTDVKSFVALSSILEGVGASAYLGAAASIMEKAYLTAAGSILTVEARHSAFLRGSLNLSPIPAPFGTPLTFNNVFSLAAPFINSFAPEDPPLPFKAFPPLLVDCQGPPCESRKSALVFKGAAKLYPAQNGGQVFAAFFSGLAPFFVPVITSGADYKIDALPDGLSGQTYVVLTNNGTSATDDTILAGPAILEIYMSNNASSTISY